MKPLYRPIALSFFILMFCFLWCALMGYYFFEESVINWIPSISIAAFLSFIFFNCSRNKSFIFSREILLTTGLLWFTATIIGTLPYILVLNCDFATGFFESVSGLTTTGASAIISIEEIPKSLLFWRSLSQWLGGLGLVIFFIPFLNHNDASNKKLFLQETSFSEDAITVFNLRRNILLALGMYLLLTIACFFVLIYFKFPYFDAICHTLSTVSTGGFSIYNGGLPSIHNVTIENISMIFMFFGGINFLFLSQIFTISGPSVIFNQEFRTYILLIVLGTCVFTFLLIRNVGLNASEAFHHAIFQTISVVTTTGVHSCDYTKWPSIGITLFLLFTFIGGCSGSTAGGFKISRTTAILKIITIQFEKIFHPSIVRSVKVNKTLLPEEKQMEILYFFVITVFVIVIGILALQIVMPNMDLLTAASAVIACLSNVGPGITSAIGPNETYAYFHPLAKIILSIIMLLGRLELYAILALFSRKFWGKFE